MDPTLTDWLQAIGGVGSFAAALVLALLAYLQIRAANRQAEAATQQAEISRDAATAQVEAAQAEALERQNAQRVEGQRLNSLILAVGNQARAVEQAAARQWQPLVYAHALGPPRFGPMEGDGVELPLGDEVEFTYYLSNEGLGPALNIDHGIELEGEAFLFGTASSRGFQFRTCRAGEFIPPVEGGRSKLRVVPSQGLKVQIPNERYWRNSEGQEFGPQPTFFCRFESMIGERWETRNTPDPLEPPDIRRAPPVDRPFG